MEQALRIFVATLAPADDAEVCDHLPLVLLVTQLPKQVERLLEVLNGHGDPAVGVNESKSQVVERQRLGAPVPDATHDRERRAMLLDGSFVSAFPPKLRAELVESVRLAAAVDFGRRRFPVVILHEGMGAPRSAVCVPLQVFPRGELVQARLSAPGDPFDRRGAHTKRTFDPVAALEPKRSGHDPCHEREDEGDEQYYAEPESPQEPGEQEPDPRECEDARTELLAIDRPPE